MLHAYNEGFGRIVGTREEIEEIAKIIFDEEKQKKVLAELPEEKYVLLKFDNWSTVDAKGLMEKFPSCELFISFGSDYRGAYQVKISDAGNNSINDVPFYVGVNDCIIDIDQVHLFFRGRRQNSIINIKLKNGRDLNYCADYETIHKVGFLESKPLSLGMLSDIRRTYVLPQKRRAAVEDTKKIIPSVDFVSSIEYISSTKYSITEDFINRIAGSKAAEKLSDVSVLRFLNASRTEETKKIYDFTTNTLTTIQSFVLSAMKDPSSNEYDIIETEYKEPIINTQSIPGMVPDDYVDLQYTISDENTCVCINCVSDFEVIKVPDKIDGYTVVGIDSNCFDNLKNVKKIILPITVKSIAKQAFHACKKLEAIVYADNPDSKEDFIICNKGKLITLFTAKTSFVIPDTISKIDKYAFSNCPKLRELTLRPGMSRLINNALAECKSLKTVNLTGNTDDINIEALKKGEIKEVILPNGKSVSIYDKCLFSCFTHTKDGMTFSYQKAAEQIAYASGETTKYKIAIDLLENHMHEIDDKAVSVALSVAIKYVIGDENVEMLSKLLEYEAASAIDFTDMIQQANRIGNIEISSMLMTKSSQESQSKKTVIRHETPAEPAGLNKLYIKVRFENNKSYSYFCNYKVKEGDKVFVAGKMAGMPGEVTAIIYPHPSGRAAMYTLEVTEAFNVTLEEVDDIFDL